MTKPPPQLPDCAPHEVTHAEVNIAQAAPPSPMRPDESPVANLFGGSLGFTLNKRQLIDREKSGHTPTRMKHGHTTCRDSSVRSRVTIQEAFSAKMSSLHVDDLLSGRVELSDYCRTTTFIQHEDSAGILLNGVNHIYGRFSVSREQERTNNNYNVAEGINNVIDEVMEYEPKILVPDIDDHVFTNAEDGVDDDGNDDEEQEMTMEIGGLMTRPC